MSDQPDQSQRSEEATPKRLEDARKKGDAPKSQEVTATVLLAAGAGGLWMLSGPMASRIADIGVGFLDHPHAISVTGASLHRLFISIITSVGLAVAGFGLLMFVAAIIANAAQARPVFTTHRMKPELKKISPLAGLKRIFGPSGLVNFGKGLGKLLIVGAIMGATLWPQHQMIINLLYVQDLSVMMVARNVVLQLILYVVLAMSIIAGLDFGWQRYSWRRRLRMTREEVRREHKESEGDPQIKARQRQLRDARARVRMANAVKEATVVIMNPTHFAVALNYQAGGQSAPVCTAKGMDEMALRMRQIARAHKVPVVENPPLARALHASAVLDQEIPLEHFAAVAKVIGFIMTKAGINPRS